ncbi:MAG: 4-hydroxy-tetrahydrodipicolinate synthase [Gammaproteobacteria bacterium]|nr:4-hydroxy-tetrahydrodipicolinate synthase [Gammaproteobacteria bacterium]
MLGGSIVAIVTPMTEGGEVDFAAFERLLDWHLDAGTDGVVVVGTTGESPTVTEAETARLLRAAVERIGGRIPVIAGTGSNSTAIAVARTRAACAAGVDAVLVVTPYYNKPTQEGLYRHYVAVADASSVPVILYNVPSRTACDLLPETVARLAAHPRIAGIKEATADLTRVKPLLAIRPGFVVLSGDDATAREFIQLGGHGVISVTANVAPRLMHEMCAAAAAGEAALARELDGRLAGLHRELFVEANPIPAKWALARLGLIPPGLRLPLTPLSDRHHATVLAAMQAAGVH